MPAKKTGRPKLPKGKARARIMAVRFSPEELRRIKVASGQKMSEWIRSTLNAATAAGIKWCYDNTVEKGIMPEPNKTINLEDFTILCDIKERLQAITQEQMDLKAGRLPKMEDGETQFGIASDLCKRMWTLADILSYEAHIEIAMAGKLADPSIIEDHKQRALIAHALHDVASELLWAQARNDNGYWAQTSIAIRTGWTLVSCPESGAPPGMEGLIALLRGKMPGR